MVIAINTKYFLKAQQQVYTKFIFECFNRLAHQQTQHTFIFISNTAFDPSFTVPENCTLRAFTAKFNAGILSGIWYYIKIISLLKKHKVDVFINADGFYLSVKVPECFILLNPACISDKEFIKKNHLFLYKKNIRSFLKKVKVIVTDSQFSKNYILQHYKASEHKTAVVPIAAGEFLEPGGWQHREKIKDQYAGGNEYFIFYSNSSQENILLNLLKAFSHFKKWQKSGMQLFIAENEALHKHFTKSLRLFKYRKDVKLLNGLQEDELTKVAAAAYAVIYFPFYESFSISAVQAMKCNIPVITCNKGSMPEVCGDSVLYANFDNAADIAEKLILIFKDEKLRQELIERGKKKVNKYNWEHTTDLLWQSILTAGS